MDKVYRKKTADRVGQQSQVVVLSGGYGYYLGAAGLGSVFRRHRRGLYDFSCNCPYAHPHFGVLYEFSYIASVFAPLLSCFVRVFV